MSLGSALVAVADHADEVVEIAKLGAETFRAVTAWVKGEGPEPGELAALPDTTRMQLAQARLERLAASGSGG